MKVSVIIPAYNAEKTLDKCLESVTNQTHRDLEIIVVNDGSTDQTESVVDRFRERDDRIKYFAQKNSGVSHARNVGLDAAYGETVMFVDSDDYIEPDMVECFLQMYDGSPVMVCGGYIKEKPDGTIVRTETGRFFRSYSTCKMYVTDIIKNNHIRFDEKISLQEDAIFVLDYVYASRNCVVVDKPLYHYVWNAKSLSARYSPSLEESERIVISKTKRIRDVYQDFFRYDTQRDNDEVIMAMKIEYNDCAIDSPVSRRERIAKLKKCYKNPIFLQQLKEKPKTSMDRVFIYLSRVRMAGLIDTIFTLVKRGK
ncbi:MAG: glycosyltransferase family 2 protein [Lachnospiraceae bacterium]|nr:glycosyltransferase family 2 protein [Lachnospiraceae bacterium]